MYDGCKTVVHAVVVLRLQSAVNYGRPYVVLGRRLYSATVVSSFFVLILSSRRLDVCYTSTHDAALMQI